MVSSWLGLGLLAFLTELRCLDRSFMIATEFLIWRRSGALDDVSMSLQITNVEAQAKAKGTQVRTPLPLRSFISPSEEVHSLCLPAEYSLHGIQLAPHPRSSTLSMH
jgi:hypothetical protein